MFTVKHMKEGIAGLVLCCLLASCATTGSTGNGGSVSGKAPGWVLNPSDGYPEAEYMTAVGYASDRQTAEANATAALTKIIRQNVQSDTVTTESISGREAEWEKARSIDTYVKTSSELVITGIVIDDVFVTNEKQPVYYALALIDRDDVGQIYKRRVLETEAAINDMIASSQNEVGPLSSYKIMKDAAALAEENEEALDILTVVNKDLRSTVNLAYKSAAAVEELARQKLDATRVFVDIRGDDTGRIEAAFALRVQEAGLKTVDAASADTAALTLSIDVSLEAIDMEASNKYVRYVLTGALVENVTGKEMEKYGTNGREAHVTEAEARARALRTLEQYVNKLNLLSDLQ